MADTIERLYKLTVDGTQAARQLGEIERATANLDKRLASSANAIKTFGSVLASAVSVGAIVGGIKSVIDSFDQLSKDAQKIGIAAEQLQRLRYAADLSGVGAEQLDSAITKLARTMGDIDSKTNKAAGALRAIGVAGGDNAVEALKKIADQFERMPDGIEKTALAAELFGKAVGPQMIPLLNAGADALQELADEADRFGGVVSGSVLASAEAFNDNISRLQRTLAGVGAQMTSGMLPALQALSQSLTDSATTGDGFVSTGEAIGEMLLNLYGFALKATTTLHAFGIVIAGVMAAASSPTNAPSIFGMMIDDINALEAKVNTKLSKLREDFSKFKTDAAAGPAAAKPSDGESAVAAAERLAAASKAAAKAADEHRKAEELRWKELIRSTEMIERANKAGEQRELVLSKDEKRALRQIEIYKELNGQVETWLTNIEDEGQRIQILTEWLETGTEAQKLYAAAQIEVAGSASSVTKTLSKQRDEVDVLTDGFDGFFENLAKGTADAEELFRRMAQSIIAELLKIWAKRYIIDAIFGADYKPSRGATGFAFDTSGVIPFARGGVISSPVVFPMALAGEAGPEAILPLRRAADGNLGVQAATSQLKVTVNNYADATVSTRRTGPNDLEVIVERTRQAIAADVAKGGSAVSRAFESTYGIGRGAAAAF